MTIHSPKPFELEREILAALCGAALTPEQRSNACHALSEHSWQSPDHRVIYEAIRRSRERDAASLHEFLKAEATRLGFPDMDWAVYLSPKNSKGAAIEILIGMLLARSSDAPEQFS